ncbi:CRISPR-associated protein Cas5 [Novacetimonas sp. GS1]
MMLLSLTFQTASYRHPCQTRTVFRHPYRIPTLALPS